MLISPSYLSNDSYLDSCRCFVGKRHLESAIETLKDQAEFKVAWKPFFLNPSTPDEGIPLIEYISSRYGPEAGRKIAEGKSALIDVGKNLVGNSNNNNCYFNRLICPVVDCILLSKDLYSYLLLLVRCVT